MKIAAAVLLALALAVTGLWASHGADIATREKVAVKTVTTDDFGDEVETVTWKAPDDYPLTGSHIGLDRAGPLAGGLAGLGIVFLVLGFRKKKTTDAAA